MAAALNYFVAQRWVRRRLLIQLFNDQQKILTDRRLSSFSLPSRPSNKDINDLLFAAHTRTADYSARGHFDERPLTSKETVTVEKVREWLTSNLPQLEELADIKPITA